MPFVRLKVGSWVRGGAEYTIPVFDPGRLDGCCGGGGGGLVGTGGGGGLTGAGMWGAGGSGHPEELLLLPSPLPFPPLPLPFPPLLGLSGHLGDLTIDLLPLLPFLALLDLLEG